MPSAGPQLVCATCEAVWEKVLEQLTFGTSCGMTKPAESSLHEQCRYACKAEAATQFHGWHTVSAPYAKNTADAVIVKDLQPLFVCYSCIE